MEKYSFDHLRRLGLSRRVSQSREISIKPQNFLQAFDFNLLIGKKDREGNKHIPGFYSLGKSCIKDEMETVAELGIKGVSLRIIDNAVGKFSDWKRHRSKWIEEIEDVNEFGKKCGLQVIVDPFSIGLQDSGQWGILNTMEESETLDLIENISEVMRITGVDGVITLGRVPKEVFVTKRSIGESVKLYSFSNNNETSTAYAGNISKTNTMQKIIPSNIKDMIAWSMMDIHHGSDFIVTKPLENYHVSEATRKALSSVDEIKEFLSDYLLLNENYLSKFELEAIKDVKNNPNLFLKKYNSISFGAYMVSGSTQMLAIYAKHEGVNIARCRLEEMWLNAILANGDGSFIIDRGCKDFFSGSILH